jgi:transcription elongation factor Elf1
MPTKLANEKPVFYFAIKATFACPKCGKENIEVMYSKATTSNPDKIAIATQTQNLTCKFCKHQLLDGTKVQIVVLPVTLEQIRAAGFNPPSDPNSN